MTPVATPGPSFRTRIVKPIWLPELTVALSAVLVTTSEGWLTVTVAVELVGRLLVAWAVAVFVRAPPVAAVVALITWTLADCVGARLPKVQESTWGLPEIVHVPGPEYAGLIDQLTPGAEGSGSLRVAPVAVPAPLFVTVTVNPTCSPAFTVALSAVLVTASAG